MTTTSLISARGLEKRYPGVVALDGVDLDIFPGEITALVGKNGAGKSTLIKTFAGVLRPDAGELTVDGIPVRFASPMVAARHGLAFVHQELADFPELSVAENVLIGRGLPRRAGVMVDWDAARDQAAAALTELDDRINPKAKVTSLSVAQRRLVMIARALVRDARLLVLDEPTAALSATEVDHLHSVVKRLAARGVSIVYVSHRLGEVFSLTTRTVVMRDGAVVADRATASFDGRSLVKEITGHSEQSSQAFRGDHERQPGATLLAAVGLGRGDVVQDVTLEVRAGEVVGIAGLVGAGRTELLRLLVGADRSTSGHVEVHRREVVMRSPRMAARHGVVLLPEDRRNEGAVMEMSIRENVTLTALDRYRRTARVATPSRAKEASAAQHQVDRLGIKTSSVENAVSTLSGGNQQKVVLAKWLARGADVFMFDEPTAGIDVDGRAEVYEQIRQLAKDGKGVLVVSSDFSEFAPICDRVIVMRDGRLAAELKGTDISEGALVAACFADQDAASE